MAKACTEVGLDDVVFCGDIYPRGKPNQRLIDELVDVLRAGHVSELEPIELDDAEETKNRLWDGYHRWKAHVRYLEEWNEASEEDAEGWAEPKETITARFSICPEGIPPILYAAQFSAKHGDRLKSSEKSDVAEAVYKENPEFSQTELAERLATSRSRIKAWIGHLIAAHKEERDKAILRLSRLGWTQQEIAEKVGLTHQATSVILQKLDHDTQFAKADFKSGFSLSQIGERKGLSIPLAASLALEGKSDEERLEAIDVTSLPYDVWTFSSCMAAAGEDYPGRIPGQLIANVLFFFTKPGDLVIDPMAGGGTTCDVCLMMGRSCYGYDNKAEQERVDIVAHDLAIGWPERLKKAQLIFWDPPYYDKKDDKNEDGGYGEGSISKLDRDAYLAFFAKAFKQAATAVKKGTRLAFLMSDWNDQDEKKEGIFLWDYSALITKAGWKLFRHIQVPLSTQQVHPDIVKKYRKSRKLARLERYLLMAVKE